MDCCPRPGHRRRPIGREAEHDLPPPLPRRLTKGRARGGRITRTAVEEKTSSATLVWSKTRRRASTIRSVYDWGGEECCVCIIIFIHATWRGPPVAAAAAAAARPVDRCRFRVYRHSAAQRSLSPSRLYSVTTKPESTAVVIQGSRLLYFLDRSIPCTYHDDTYTGPPVLQECTWPAGTGSSGQHRFPAVREWGGPVNMSYWDHHVSIPLHPPTKNSFLGHGRCTQ